MQRLTRTVVVVSSLVASAAQADSTSGVDSALFRPSYDTNGILSVEGARLMPKRDLSLKFHVGYAQSPIDVAVPGIGGMDDTKSDRILDYLMTVDMTFGMSITERIALAFDIGAYRTATGEGYGVRGRYDGGMIAEPSTGLIGLRPLSNIDQSADPDDPYSYLGDGLAGPLDVRAALKFGLIQEPKLALALVATVGLPFGDDQMLLGDKNLVYEPKLALELRKDRISQTRFIANVGARIRNRAILEGYDSAAVMMPTTDDAKVFLDVGSEAVAGVGAVYELAPRALVAAEATAFVPLPTSIGYGKCTRYNGLSCSTIDSDDYWGDAGAGDLTVLAAAGLMFRVSADLTLDVMASTGQLGARGDDFRITTGLVWAPQPEGVAAPGRNDRDGDRIPDSVDACSEEPEDMDGHQDEDGCADADNDGDGIADADDACANEPEDKDGFQDSDGCPERDNDNDGVPDAADKCPNEGEDNDGFEDDDGCPDQDNDGDKLPDTADRCPNDPETVNGFDDDDGCPDVRATSGPEERGDRIDLKGQQITFDRTNKLTAASRTLLSQVATIIKNRKLTIRIEVHVPLGTKSKAAGAIRAQKARDKQTSQRRAVAIQEYLVSQGVAASQLQAVGLGSERPLGSATPTDPTNERVDLIKAQQARTP